MNKKTFMEGDDIGKIGRIVGMHWTITKEKLNFKM